MPFRIKVSLAVLLSLLTVLLIGPLIYPISPLSDTVDPHDLADPDSRFIRVNDIEVHYKQSTLEPLEPDLNFILLHGFGASSYSWHAVLDELGRYGTAVAFDRPAFGLTERPMRSDWQENPYTAEAQIALTIALMDALGMETAVLIGNSAGGSLATQLALNYPARVAGLVLISAAVYQGGGTPAIARPLLYTPQLNRLGPLFMRQFAEEPGLNFLRSAWSDEANLTQDIIDAYRKPLRTHNWDKALWELTKASRESKLEGRLGDISIPALVITGLDDRIVPVKLSERLASDLPNAQLAMFDDCGHVPQEECPLPFLEVVIDWLQDNQLIGTDF